MRNSGQPGASQRPGEIRPGMGGGQPDTGSSGSRLVLDETTIYEIDLECCQCMTRQERIEAGLEETY